MDRDLSQRAARRARLRYEGSRARDALLGVTPSIALVVAAVCLGRSPGWASAFGALTFVCGGLLLWYGRELKRAVLPSLFAGTVPAALALCATHFGHACMGGQCMTLCVPACSIGGVVAGLMIAAVGVRGRYGIGFWAAASALTLFTGAMGCACVGNWGVVGLGLGFVVGLVPRSSQRWFESRSS